MDEPIMTTGEIIFTFFFGFMLITCIFYVLLGQITVKRLRKNTETKDSLGVEFVSGWDILNVAQALSLPRSWNEKMEKSPASFLNADFRSIEKNTNKLDKIIAKTFTFFFLSTGLLIAIMLAHDLFSGPTTQ
ncbi:hypothetical protein [Microbulbifer aggregans]|uniref:hypothetical protein n=1 Tax=Microbulbifer aggregans TaxID=1769779 RepID=UPI001CFE681E|nr:hypothetical protein [Microbulbifer aggregans]